MGFSPDFLDRLRQRLPLSTVIGRTVKLVKKGRQFQGLCPFHSERTPSFFVSDERAHYHCFGCGEHGDIISFVMKTSGARFPEAVAQLAEEAGLELPRNDTPPEIISQRQNLLATLEAACRFFQQALASTEAHAARRYLETRQVTAADLEKFRIGWAPNQRHALRRHLAAQGFTEESMIAAGLVAGAKDEADSYDRFRGRILFPIADDRGRIIAFGGRTLGDGQPKYLNSPETALFQKGHILYGLHHARARVNPNTGPNAGRPPPQGAILVEGYLDVIALHRAGFTTAMAPLGTALTEEHLAHLWKFSTQPVLCFDGDRAGLTAAHRAAIRALPLVGAQRSLSFVTLPAGQDPDDLLKNEQGPAILRNLLDSASPLSEVIWQAELAAAPLDTPERQSDFHRRWRERVQMILDPTTQDFYRKNYQERERALFRPDFAKRAPSSPSGPSPSGPARAAAANKRSSGWIELSPRRRALPTPERLYQQTIPTAVGLNASHLAATMTGAQLLASLLALPVLIEEFLDELARLPSLKDQALDRLLGALLDITGRSPGLDSAALEDQLVKGGMSPALAIVRRHAISVKRSAAEAEGDIANARHRAADIIQSFAKQANDIAGHAEGELATAMAHDMAQDGAHDLEQQARHAVDLVRAPSGTQPGGEREDQR